MIVEAIPGKGRMARVTRSLEGKPCVCIATGPSLSQDQVEVVRQSGAAAIVVNDAYLLAPFARLAYFADTKWWRWHKDREEWKAFAGQKCTINVGPCEEKSVLILERSMAPDGFSKDPTSITTGSHSGFQALSIAYLAGANPIILLGYDCRAVGGKDHYFGSHPDKTMPPYASIRTRYAPAAAEAKKAGVRIVNATPDSAIPDFERVDIASVLVHPAGALV